MISPCPAEFEQSSIMKKKFIISSLLICLTVGNTACEGNDNDSKGDENESVETDIASRNIERAITITDAATEAFISSDPGYMYKYYNPYTDQVTDSGNENIWEFSSSFEAAANILLALDIQKEKGNSELYDLHFDRIKELADRLYNGMQYFKGTYQLTSYTKIDHPWTVYGVPRASSPGSNNVTGTLNVYDDQMWLIRDFIEVYKATGDKKYLDEAEYLAEYVIDGYDCHVDSNGNEYGGITWGPGYVTKHSCSNGPAVAPLVWLSEIYSGSEETATRYYIDPEDKVTRLTEVMDKSDYYLYYAERVYEYQKTHLMREDGVYDDMMGGADPDNIYYEDNGYRGHNDLKDRVGPAYSYNSGAILSGAAELYRITQDPKYLEDAKALTEASFKYFATPDTTVEGLYTYDFSGNNSWFNAVLLRGYIDASRIDSGADLPVDSFQKIYDHGYDNFMYEGFMPNSVYLGWANAKENRKIRGRDQFAYAAQFALLARYDLENQ